MGISALPVMASALPDESCSGTVNEEQQEILWQGDVILTNRTTITVTAHNSGVEYEVNETTALGALDAAATAGAFNYTVTDEWGFLFADSIADVAQEGWSGWIYWVNYPAKPMPLVGATDHAVEDGDVVTWYWSSSMEMTPADSPLLVIINVSVTEDPTSPTPDPTLEPTPALSPRRSGGRREPQDSDADGYSDIKELLAETNPNDPTDYPGKVRAEVTMTTPAPSSTPMSTPALTPTATLPQTSVAITPPPASSTATLQAPGFEAIALIAGLLATACILKRKTSR
ncbi:MAG: DUF4430 domain-containing protein [Candidatus Methanospirareceae archaeon]